MSNDFTICVGTIGSGIWRSPDGGETWTRVRPSRYPENDVRALAREFAARFTAVHAAGGVQ